MTGLTHGDLVDLRRWAVCGAVIVLAHAGLAAGMATWQAAEEPAEAAAAVVIEFAPIAAAPAIQHNDLPPGPEMTASDASPNVPSESRVEQIEERIEHAVEVRLERKVEKKVEAKPVEEPPPELPPAREAEVAVEPLPQQQRVQQEAPPAQDPHMPAPLTAAPQAITDVVAALPAAPAPGRLVPTESKAVPTWKARLVAVLERNKRYPPAARTRREQGVAKVFFSLDRQGRVIESRVVQSSGAAALDAAALALLERAQPFPLPPPELGARVDVTVPIRFNLK